MLFKWLSCNCIARALALIQSFIILSIGLEACCFFQENRTKKNTNGTEKIWSEEKMQMLELNYVISSSVDSIGTVSIIFHVWLTSLLLFWFWRFSFNWYCFLFVSLQNTFCVMAQLNIHECVGWFLPFILNLSLTNTHIGKSQSSENFCWVTIVSAKLFPLNVPKWKWWKYFSISIYHNNILKIG